MIGQEDLENGGLRMLEVDNRVILPELTHVRFIITSSDVIQGGVRFHYMDLKSGKSAASFLPFSGWALRPLKKNNGGKTLKLRETPKARITKLR